MGAEIHRSALLRYVLFIFPFIRQHLRVSILYGMYVFHVRELQQPNDRRRRQQQQQQVSVTSTHFAQIEQYGSSNAVSMSTALPCQGVESSKDDPARPGGHAVLLIDRLIVIVLGQDCFLTLSSLVTITPRSLSGAEVTCQAPPARPWRPRT